MFIRIAGASSGAWDLPDPGGIEESARLVGNFPRSTSRNVMLIPTLAHMGGIDEIGLILLPAAVAFLSLRWAERRAKRQHAQNEPADQTPNDQETS